MKQTTLAARLTPILPSMRCPHCGGALTLLEGKSLHCASRHCYDLSVKGYVNLAPTHNQAAEKYDAALFESRAHVFAGGYYTPMAQAIGDAIARYMPAFCTLPQAAGTLPNADEALPDRQRSHTPAATSATANAPFLLDVGCGEGYYTRALAARFPQATFVGVDLSRDAIQHAARLAPALNWFVADLTHLPFADASADVLLDVLTPADYREFARVLKPEGLLVKVIPADDYLTQVRAAVANHLRGKDFSNARVLEHLRIHANVLSQTTVRHTLPVTPQQAQAFLRMTPMTFGLAEAVLADVTFSTITIALEVLVCRMR